MPPLPATCTRRRPRQATPRAGARRGLVPDAGETRPRRTSQEGATGAQEKEQMNGRRAARRTKACKMAFSRTAGGAAGPSAGEGCAGAGGLVRRAARPGQKPATWRALGPPRPAPYEAGSRAGRAQESAAAGPRGQPAGSRTRWAGARRRPPGAALLLPRPRCSRQANPIRPLHPRETEASRTASALGRPGGPRGFPPAFPTSANLGWVRGVSGSRSRRWSPGHCQGGAGARTQRGGGGRRGRQAEVGGSSSRPGGRQGFSQHCGRGWRRDVLRGFSSGAHGRGRQTGLRHIPGHC